MSTSGATASTMTAFELIAAALRRGHVLRENQVPDMSLFEQCRGTLTRMLKAWTMDGANLWRDEEQTLTLVSGRSEYTLAERPIRIRNVRLYQNGREMRPLAEWSRDDYDIAPVKSQTGAPVAFVIDRRRAETRLILWPIPNTTTYTVKVGVERVIEDIETAEEEIDAPQEWLEAVIDNAAVRFADEEGVNAALLQTVRFDAARGYARAQGFDRGPVTFEVAR